MGLILQKSDGTPNAFSKALDVWIERGRRNTDTTIAITGPLGSGKSTLGIGCCKELAKREAAAGLIQKDAVWNMVDDGIWNANKKEMHDKVMAKEYMPLLFDEMLTMSSKHNWASTLALYAESLFLINRTQKRSYFLIGPRLGGFAENFRNSRIQLNILCLRKGQGVLLRRHNDPNVADPWFLREMEKEIKGVNDNAADAQEFLFTSNRIKFYENRINFICRVNWTPLTREEQAEYDVLRDRLARNSVQLDSPKTMKEKVAKSDERLVSVAEKLVLEGKSVKEIAELMGTTTPAVNRYLSKAAEKLSPRKVDEVAPEATEISSEYREHDL